MDEFDSFDFSPAFQDFSVVGGGGVGDPISEAQFENYDFNNVFSGAADPIPTNWGNVSSDVSTVANGIGGLLKGVGSIVAANNSTAGAGQIFNPLTGKLQPITAGIFSSPGVTSAVGATAAPNLTRGVGNVIGSVFGSITPYLPMVIIAAIGIFLIKMLLKK